MINLLQNEFKNFINTNASHLPPFAGVPIVISETTANVDFDIEDPKRLAPGSSFILRAGACNATYNNQSARTLTFICYDEYLTQFDDNANHYLRCRGIGRADFVAFSADNNFQFLLFTNCLSVVEINMRKESNNCLVLFISFKRILLLRHL